MSRSPYLHALELVLARPIRAAGAESLTTKENAKGEALIESFTTYREDGEDHEAWIDRHVMWHMHISIELRPTVIEGGS